jgi:hypothetical protein
MEVQMKNLGLFCYLILAYSFAFGAGNEWKPIHGEYAIVASPVTDPIPGNPPVAIFLIEGDAAKKIYDSMVNPKIYKEDLCQENGGRVKSVGNIVCTKHKSSYSCHFGIGLDDGESRESYTC